MFTSNVSKIVTQAFFLLFLFFSSPVAICSSSKDQRVMQFCWTDFLYLHEATPFFCPAAPIHVNEFFLSLGLFVQQVPDADN